MIEGLGVGTYGGQGRERDDGVRREVRGHEARCHGSKRALHGDGASEGGTLEGPTDGTGNMNTPGVENGEKAPNKAKAKESGMTRTRGRKNEKQNKTTQEAATEPHNRHPKWLNPGKATPHR